MGWLGPDATSVVNPTEVELLVYFLLYSVVCTVESFFVSLPFYTLSYMF